LKELTTPLLSTRRMGGGDQTHAREVRLQGGGVDDGVGEGGGNMYNIYIRLITIFEFVYVFV